MKKQYFLILALLFMSMYSNAQVAVDEVRLYFDVEKVASKQIGMDLSKSGKYIAFAFENGMLNVFDTDVNRFIFRKIFQTAEVFEIRFSINEGHIILVTAEDVVIVDWKKEGKILLQETLPDNPTRVAVSIKNNLLVVGTMNLHVLMYDLNRFIPTHTMTMEKGHHISGLSFNEKENLLLVYSRGTVNQANWIEVFDVETWSIFAEIPKEVKKKYPFCANFIENESSIIVYTMTGHLFIWNPLNGSLDVRKIKLSELKNFILPSTIVAYGEEYISSGYFLGFAVLNSSMQPVFTTKRTIRSDAKGGRSASWQIGIDVQNIKRIRNTSKFIINSFGDNVNHIYDAEKRQIIGYFYSDANDDFAVVARNGQVDGNDGVFSKLAWTTRKSKIKTPLGVNLENNITPKLFTTLVYGEGTSTSNADLMASLEMAPNLTISSPDSISSSTSRTLDITYTTAANGDPVKDVMVKVNGKKMNTDTRGFKKMGETISVTLVPGQNIVQLAAVSQKGYQSIPDQIIVNYSGAPAQSELFLLTIGVNKYKNPRYNLNYANADADAFKSSIIGGGKNIFESVKQYHISDENATKSNIESTFNQLVQEIGPEDVFVFYYAGHGVMSEDDQPKFYLIPHEVTQLYGDNETMKGRAISADQLKAYSSSIAAQKQLFILDACQSGGMTEMLAMRGAAEEKAIAQLARSTGTYWLTASGSQQFATEFAMLGHGLFTYTILEGLGGKADGGSMDSKITVKELSAYLNDRVPELSEQHKGQAQYPTSYGFGQDFPIVIVE